jgi:putative bacteriocin precursor
MSCNGYHTLKWYYTYPQHPYKWTYIRGRELIEFEPRTIENYCPCRQNCQCPYCSQQPQQRLRQQINQIQQQPQQPQQIQPVQSQGNDCGCSL